MTSQANCASDESEHFLLNYIVFEQEMREDHSKQLRTAFFDFLAASVTLWHNMGNLRVKFIIPIIRNAFREDANHPEQFKICFGEEMSRRWKRRRGRLVRELVD